MNKNENDEPTHIQTARQQIQLLLGELIFSLHYEDVDGIFYILVEQNKISLNYWQQAVNVVQDLCEEANFKPEMITLIECEDLEKTYKISATGVWILEMVVRHAVKICKNGKAKI